MAEKVVVTGGIKAEVVFVRPLSGAVKLILMTFRRLFYRLEAVHTIGA